MREVVAGWPHPIAAWLVEERVPVDPPRSVPSGTRTPGLRMVGILRRRPGISREAFDAHWRGPHTQIARSYTIPFWRYDQNVVVEPLVGDSGEDGFVGMHFETREQMETRWTAHPAEAARGAADAELFMDTSRSPSVVMIETVWRD